ncbi:precorrin-2 dehydrogenase/sirohydrochlorin ferrochelatase family protein [Alkalicoccobacillus gibsonii]|uniref:precorrin-2 dehydrogenase/sirohydrochlorin ferrochelatase family protein n=1 Tax=Alkalicoccobacillus gibsonii TaxID=79881 RepID=UPI003F7B484D
MPDRIPLMVNVRERSVTCVGGGKVAAKRIPILIEGGATVTIISPTLNENLLSLLPDVVWEKRKLTQAETFTSDILFISTDDSLLNDELIAKAAKGQWIYAAHDAKKSDFHFPAVLEEPPVSLSIHTGSAYPAYLPKIKSILSKALHEANVHNDLKILAEVRQMILNHPSLSREQRTELLRACATDAFLQHPEKDQLLMRWIHEKSV